MSKRTRHYFSAPPPYDYPLTAADQARPEVREAARAERDDEIARRRLDEARCSWEYLQYGDTRGEHADDCVRHPVCSLDYDPGPAPDDIRLYEGTTLGALWGLFTPEGATQLLNAVRSGWVIAERRPT